jgi:hypothetical protein
MSRQIAVEFYAELEPKMGRRYNATTKQHEDIVESARVRRTTVSKPDNVGASSVVVKLRVYVPQHLFIAGIPEAIIVVPEDPGESVTVNAVYQED